MSATPAKPSSQRNLDWRLILRMGRVLLHIVGGMATCAFIFPFSGLEKRNAHIRRWSRQLLAICNVSVQVTPGSAAALEQGMVVCNHVSWLDIFVINALHPCRFVAKAEIRDWPLAGWLAAQAGTVFIARGNKRELRNIFKGLVHALQEGQRVAFFPEGTTAAQGSILPFHANLFEAAVDGKVKVQPFALSYLDPQGQPHAGVDFIGDMTFVQSVANILDGLPVRARLSVLEPMDTEGAHRRELAQASHDAIGTALGILPEAQSLREQSA
ncbi:lysophospholipid acyltransferase family protein [Pseudoduganella violaceinigra]|uniref:lysophospholipid acyltransferase family protein n=1 Tax=Pseudoduganella violaceinigra TaxID=246602 RepID=UPI000413DB63|nr:lysophospholipid acyltransferase family protein [Pseudoduganella violaceinigra]